MKITSVDKNGKTWISLIDYLKALAICLVIVNHSLFGEARDSWWFFFIVRMAVPIFVLVSGYNFTLAISKMDSPWQWYNRKRMARKLRTYLFPMFAVFLLWLVKEMVSGHFSFVLDAKAFVLQSYGLGAYYFWIVIWLYLLFPLTYWLTFKFKRGGVIVLLLNIIYEVVLYFVPIPNSLYRIIGLRYIMLLTLGSIIYKWINEEKNKAVNPIFMVICFIFGCAYIAFFSMNKDNTEIFRYTTWGNTNVFSCMYIAPLFYATLALFKDSQIKLDWLHRLVSVVGQSSYYILCTQMVMFWVIGKVWSWASLPLVPFVICNIFLSVVLGLCVHRIVNELKMKSFKQHINE